jgi:cyanophycinase
MTSSAPIEAFEQAPTLGITFEASPASGSPVKARISLTRERALHDARSVIRRFIHFTGDLALTPRLLAIALGAALAAGCSGGASTSGAGGGGASTSTSGTSSASSSSSGGGGSGGAPEVEPPKPPALESFLTGNAADADVVPSGPALILMGGGPDVDAAFAWQKPLIAGGDLVVLRTSGADGYNDYLFTEIGGADSVETLLVTTEALAEDPYVLWKLRHAEGIFLAGGDQATYLKAWKDRGVESALMEAWGRGAVIGGTSAGCAVLGAYAFAAYQDTVYSDEALADPYNMYMTMERGFLALSPLSFAITDTHFAERDRMGRLVSFLGRILADGWSSSGAARGIGVDEGTALVIDAAGSGTVMGSGAVYLVEAKGAPTQCAPGKPLEMTGLGVRKLVAGDTVSLPSGESAVPLAPLSASGGTLSPMNPY